MIDVWTYWAGPKPRWVSTCLRSIEGCCKASRFHLLTPESLPDLPLHDRWKELPPGVGTDCLRAALLSQYGGLWMDADTVCITDPAGLVTNRHEPSQFLYMRWPRTDRIIAGYVYAPRSHPVANRWLDGVNSALHNCKSIGWGDLGERLLTVAALGCEPSWEIPLDTFLPIDIDREPYRYFQSSSDARGYATRNTIAFGLNYSWMMAHKEAIMTANTKGSPFIVHQLLAEAERNYGTK